MVTVDDNTGRVVGGDELDNDYSRCILSPYNGRQSGRPTCCIIAVTTPFPFP